jgi:type II secretory pathway pseudopilin PulG
MNRQKLGLLRPALNSAGISFVEVLVSTAILVTTAYVSISYFSSQKKIVRNLAVGSSCKIALENQLSYFRQQGNTPFAMGWNDDPTGGNIHIDPQSFQDQWLSDSVRVTSADRQAKLVKSVGGTIEMNSALLQKSALGTLSSLYNNVPNICGGIALSEIPAKAGFIFNPLANVGLNNFNSTIQIEPYNLDTGIPECLGVPFYPRPRGIRDASLPSGENPEAPVNNVTNPPEPAIVSFPPGVRSDYGFQVTLNATYIGNDGKPESCTTTEKFSYPVDQYVKAPSVILNAYDISLDRSLTIPNSVCPNTPDPQRSSRAECSQKPGVDRSNPNVEANMVLEIGFQNPDDMEPGSIFLCRDASRQLNYNYCQNNDANMRGSKPAGAYSLGNKKFGSGAPWVPCNEVEICGVKPSSVKFKKIAADKSKQIAAELKYRLTYQTTAAQVDQNLWGCEARVNVATVDMAGNFKKLTEVQHPLFQDSRVSAADTLKYFQGADCWSCYKKKKKNWASIAAVAFGFGTIGLLIYCGGGNCAPKGMRFKGFDCRDKSGGNIRCKLEAKTQNFPSWWGNLPAASASNFEGIAMSSLVCDGENPPPNCNPDESYLSRYPDICRNSSYFCANPYTHYLRYGINEGRFWGCPEVPKCQAVAGLRFSNSYPQTFDLPELDAGQSYDADPLFDRANAIVCEASAECVASADGKSSSYMGVEFEDSTDRAPIATCSNIIVQKRLDIGALLPNSPPPANGVGVCVTATPFGAIDMVAAIPISRYAGFKVCDPAVTGKAVPLLCKDTGGVITYPKDPINPTQDILDPAKYIFFEKVTPVPDNLPTCEAM